MGLGSYSYPGSPECVELDFNHSGIWQSAPIKGSANASGTFAPRCARANCKKSPSFEYHNRFASYSEEASGHRCKHFAEKGITSEGLPKLFQHAINYVRKIL